MQHLEFRGISKTTDYLQTEVKYIFKHGKPDNIERASDTRGYVVETWIYKNLNQRVCICR